MATVGKVDLILATPVGHQEFTDRKLQEKPYKQPEIMA